MPVPQIGEVVERLVKGQWVPDWMRQVRDGERSAVLMWGEHREEYKRSDVWRERVLKEMPPISKYTNPQGLWLRYGKPEQMPGALELPRWD